jgi:signal transduction histidine kinase
MSPPGAQNELLSMLDEDSRGALALVPTELPARTALQEPGMPVLSAYFPVTAVASLISTMESGASADVALIGREGMVGLSGLLGSVESPTTTMVQIPGLALKTSIAALRDARQRFKSVRSMLDRYTEARFIQIAQAAACNRLHSVDRRLARLLLEIDDRVNEGRFTLSQEFIAQMLGVQRPTASIAMHGFAERGAVSYRRRAIVITDRAKLEHLACECHGVLRREFARLRHSIVAGSGGVSPSAATSNAATAVESGALLETLREIAGRLLLANIRESEAREGAEAANRTKDQFLALLSHELRTPLNAILGWCSVLKTTDRAPIERGLEVIQQNAQAQLKLVEDLLDTARIAAATMTIKPGPVDLGELAQSAVDAVKPAADGKQVKIDLTIPTGLPPMLADADRMRQVLLNVLGNAVKYTDAGGAVNVSVTASSDVSRVTVRDTGRGIAPDVLPHVFDRFRQGSVGPAGSRGMGLGLTIAQVITELHGGAIRIDSAGEGQGTTCTIDVPSQLRRRSGPDASSGAPLSTERRIH